VNALTSLSQLPNSKGVNSYVVAFSPGEHSTSHALAANAAMIGKGTEWEAKFESSVMEEKVVDTPPSGSLKSV
jgi:hypothetical protein